MRLFVTACVLLALIPAAAAQAPLGARLGPEVSRAERDYFGLFPAAGPSFASAALVRDGDRVNVVVRRTDAPDTTLVVERDAAEAVARYVETFEQAQTPFTNPYWQSASGAARTPRLDAAVTVPFVDVRNGITRVTVGGRLYDGVVLAASDTALVLHAAGEPYDWQRPRVVRIAAADILEVQRGPSGRERLSWTSSIIGAAAGLLAATTNTFLLDGGVDSVPLLVGAAVGGAVVAEQFGPRPPTPGAYADRLPDLRRQAAFRVRVPLDFPRLVTGETAAFSSEALPPLPPPALAVRRLARWHREYGLVSVALIGGPAGGLSLDQTYTEFFRNQNPSAQTSAILTNPSDLDIGVDVAVRPVPWVRAGATWTRTSGPVPEVTDEEVAVVTPGALRGYAELVAPTPRVGGFGLEVALGAGIERTTVEVRGQPFRGTDRTVEYAIAKSASNRFLQATAELVMPRRTSFFVRLTTRTLPTVAVPAAEAASVQFPGVVVYRLDAHEVVFGNVREVSWGTRFRF